MLKNFLVKRGDQLGFTITFTSATPITSAEWGIKKSYDDQFTILKSMEDKPFKVVFVGDSYLVGINPDGDVTPWGRLAAKDLNYSSSQYIIKAYGGSGFTRYDVKTFGQMINEMNYDAEVTDVVLCGGYNDIFATEEDVLSGMRIFQNNVKNKFPNATIKISMVGWSKISANQFYLLRLAKYYKNCCNALGIYYMDGVEDSIHNNIFLSSDNIHPTQDGQQQIANRLEPYLPVPSTGDIYKVNDYQYQFILRSSDTAKLDVFNYLYDIRIKVGDVVSTPLSGKLMVKDSVFED